MSTRKHLTPEHREIFDNYFRKALAGTADARQAEAIAMERTLFDIMKASAAVAHDRLVGRYILSNPHYVWER